MNILIFFPYNLRTVEQQSVMEMLVKQGHHVTLLTTVERGFLHSYVETLGVKAYATGVAESDGKLKFYTANLKKLAAVINENKIDVVIAHQQVPALIAGLLKKVKKFRLIFVRHNSDEDYQLAPLKAKWLNIFANKLTPLKVAPSSVVEEHWKQFEKVDPKKIHRINYGYNFSQYEMPDLEQVQKIKNEFPTSFRILSIARLMPTKRHSIMFHIVAKLIKEGVDCKLICLGSGALAEQLQQRVKELKLEKHIFLLGRKNNIFDYIAAADVFLHLSNTEASNSAVKEVGLLHKPVIVCKGVGDFDDYIIHKKNGFLVDKEKPFDESYEILKRLSQNVDDRKEIGEKLYETVIQKFDINNIVSDYEKILKVTR